MHLAPEPRQFAPLCLGLSTEGRGLNGRWRSFTFYISPLCDKMRQVLVWDVPAVWLWGQNLHMENRTGVTHCPLGVNPSVPHHSHPHIRPVHSVILYCEARLCVYGEGWGGWGDARVAWRSLLSTLRVCGSLIGNPGSGSGKCHRDTQPFQMILLQPTE